MIASVQLTMICRQIPLALTDEADVPCLKKPSKMQTAYHPIPSARRALIYREVEKEVERHLLKALLNNLHNNFVNIQIIEKIQQS